jgi:hypothetical protein
MPEPNDATPGFTAGHRARFFAHLDRLAAKNRPVYGFAGQQPSLWQRLGGGTSYVLVVFFPDHVVLSTRRMSSHRETSRSTRLLAEIASISVSAGLLRSTVVLGLVGGAEIILANVSPAAAEPLARFDDAGLAAFSRDSLTPGAVSAFFVACSRTLPLPGGLFTETE